MIVRVSWLALFATLLGALVVRCIGFDHLPGINGDEPQYAVHVLQWLRGEPVSFRTGTGLPMNAPLLGAVLLLQLLAAPTLATLRMVPLLYSVFAVVLAFVLFRKRGDHFAAMLATLVAVLPMHLGYARLAWDPSLVPTMMVVALAAATRVRPLATIVAFAFCLWVHPTTVFSLPVLLAPFVITKWPRRADGRLQRPSWRWVCGGLLIVALGAGGLATLVAFEALPSRVLMALRPERITAVVQRLASPGDAAKFALQYAELISGPTVYRHVVGTLPDASAWLHVSAFFAITLALGLTALRKLIAAARWIDLAVIIGLLISVVSAYLLGGLPMLNPKTARYGMFLTVPTCFALTACLDALGQDARAKAFMRAACALVGTLLLVSFSVNFLSALHHPNAQRENTFRTGEVDPKQQALLEILRMRTPGRTALVFAEDWWIYWTLRYLAEREDGVRVTILGMPWDYRFPRDFTPPAFDPKRVELFGVAWAGGDFDAQLARHSDATREVRGYEPVPILRVHRWADATPSSTRR